MAVVLYRQGTTHEENGVKCEMQVVNEYSFMHLLEDGWFFSPEEAYKKKSGHDWSDEEKEIRALAKEAGIKNWHNRKIETLKEMLDDTQS